MRTKGSHDPLWEVIREILRYLLDHPDAVDTVEGITKWWLPEGAVNQGKGNVRKALDTLVSRGWLTKRKLSSLKLLYGLKKQCLEEVREFLKKSEVRR